MQPITPTSPRIPLLIVFVLLLVTVNLARASDKPIVFGVLPSESAVSKFKRYAPLRDYLSMKLQRQVILETAKDFPEFVARSKERRYDMLETAPHFVPATLDSGNYEVITTLDQPLHAVVIVLKDSPLTKIEDLRGKLIGTPSPTALITLVGKDMLAKHGLMGEGDFTQKLYKTHNAAYEAVANRQIDAAIIASNQYIRALHSNLPLRAIATGVDMPNMSILVATNLPREIRNALRTELVGMSATEAGKKALEQMAYPGYRAATAAEFEDLRRYYK